MTDGRARKVDWVALFYNGHVRLYVAAKLGREFAARLFAGHSWVEFTKCDRL